jgi:hypothetical protein
MIIGTPVFMRRRQMTIETDVIQRQESLDGDLCINKYKVLDVIGQGSFGLVRKAVDDDGKPYVSYWHVCTPFTDAGTSNFM